MIKELLPADGSGRTRKAAGARARAPPLLLLFLFFFHRASLGIIRGLSTPRPAVGRVRVLRQAGGRVGWRLCDGGRFRAETFRHGARLLGFVCLGSAVYSVLKDPVD